jgi:hypothetical protein
VAGVCPECGRGFDAGDARTFEQWPRARRRRRWIVRGAVAAVVIGLGVVLIPRGYSTGSVSMKCSCGEAVSATRSQLVGPSWLPIGYPYWTEISGTATAGHQHLWIWNASVSRKNLKWPGRLVGGGAASASSGTSVTVVGTVNGVDVTPETAREVVASLARMMAMEKRFGVRTGRRIVGGAAPAAVGSGAATSSAPVMVPAPPPRNRPRGGGGGGGG